MTSRDLDSMMGFSDDAFATRHQVAHKEVGQKVLEVVPPMTKANFLSFAKVNCFAFYTMCIFFFVYAAILPTIKDYPYGGLNPADFRMGGHTVIIVFIIVLLAARLASMFWRTTFIQLVEVTLLLELTTAVFVIVWWHWGVPLLATLVFASLMNLGAFQNFWYTRVKKIVGEIKENVPVKPKSKGKDKTNLSNVPSMREWTDMMGITDDKDTKKDEEKSGHFEIRKHTVKHAVYLENAYKQAMDNSKDVCSPAYDPQLSELEPVQEKWYENMIIFADLVNSLCWFLTCIMLGLWIGESTKDLAWTASAGACVTITVAFGIVFFFYMCRTFSLLGRTRGIPVAEKEWLTYDMAKNTNSRTSLVDSAVDQSSIPIDQQDDETGRDNLVFCWKCLFDVFRRTGCGFLASVCSNLAISSKLMFEHATEYEYKKFMGAFWDITIDGIIAQAFVIFALMTSTIMYFSSDIFIDHEVPKPMVVLVAFVCIGSAIWKCKDLYKILMSISDEDADNGHRPTVVGESVILVVALFLLTFIGLFAFVFPMILGHEPSIGDCKRETFHDLLPAPCRNQTIYYD